MKKFFSFGLAVTCLYFLSVFIRAELEEQKAEKCIVQILTEVSSPWDASLVRKNGSEWLIHRAPLSPEKFAELAANDLGSLREIIKKPTCKFQAGYERGDSDKKYGLSAMLRGVLKRKRRRSRFDSLQNLPLRLRFSVIWVIR